MNLYRRHNITKFSIVCPVSQERGRAETPDFSGVFAGINGSLEKLAEIVHILSYMLSFFQRFPRYDCGKLFI